MLWRNCVRKESVFPSVLPRLSPCRRLQRICAPVVEAIESRLLLSFSADVAALPTATDGQNYAIHLAYSGSAPSSYTVHWGDGNSDTINSPSDPQTAQHTYATGVSGTKTVSVTANLSGGGTYNVPFALNSAFANNAGKTVIDPTSNSDNGNAMAIDPNDGSIYVVGAYNNNGSSSEFAVTKFGPDGALKTTFGTNGTQTITFDSGLDIAHAVAVDGSGNVLVAGSCSTGFAVARLDSSGNFDTSFNSTGKVSGIQSGGCTGVLAESDGKVVLVGNNGSDIVMVRLTNGGALDTTFNSTGKKTVDFPNADTSQANAIIQEPWGSGNLLIGGSACESSPSAAGIDFGLVSVSVSDGSIDTSWGSSGYVATDFYQVITGDTTSGSVDVAYGLATWLDGSFNYHVLAVGSTTYSDGSDHFAVARYNTTGNLESGFNTTGLQVGTNGDAFGAAVDQNDNVFLAGKGTPGTTNDDFVLEGFSASNGAVDSGFGNSGIFSTDFGTSSAASYDQAHGIGVEPSNAGTSYAGTIVAAGWTGSTSVGGKIAVAQYLPSNTITVNSSGGSPFLVAAATPLASTATDSCSLSSGSDGSLPGSVTDLTGKRKTGSSAALVGA